MPPKRPSHEEDPPSATSDTSEDVESGDEEESGEEELDQSPLPKSSMKKPSNSTTTTTTTKPDPTPKSVPQPDVSSSEDVDSDEHSESDEESPEKPKPSSTYTAVNVKPISSKPMTTTTPKSQKGNKSVANATVAATPPKPSGSSKRGLETEKTEKDEKESSKQPQKRKKVADVIEGGEEIEKKSGEDQKKDKFARVFTEEDEIVVLKGMISFLKKGKNATADPDEFLESIKDSLRVKITKGQLKDKMNRLRQKYHNILKKTKEGEEPNLTKAHEQKSYQLSKKIWGGGAGGSSGTSGATGADGNSVGNDTAQADGKKGKTQKPSNGVVPVASPKRKASSLLSEISPKVEPKVEEEEGSELLDTVLDSGINLMSMPPMLEGLFSKAWFLRLESSKQKQFQTRWRKLVSQEAKAYMDRGEFLRDLTRTMVETLESDES